MKTVRQLLESPSAGWQIALAVVALLASGLIVFAPYVNDGGFFADDWGNASLYQSRGYLGMAIDTLEHWVLWRPGLAFLLPIPHALFGLSTSYHLGSAILLSLVASLGFFAFLRTLQVELPHALALALLSFLFPWSDALRLWATASLNSVALIAYFTGFVLGVRALRAEPAKRARRMGLHAASAALYLVSVLTYEAAAPAILLSGVLYRVCLPWRAVRVRWLFDVVLVVLSLAVFAIPASRERDVGSLGERIQDIPEFLTQSASLFASTFLPAAMSSVGAKALVLVATATIVALAAWRARRQQDHELTKWLQRTLVGVVGIGLGYVMFLGYGLYPLSEGFANRINIFSAFGYVVATYSVIALLALLIRGGWTRSAAAVLAIGSVLVAVGFVDRTREHIELYEAAAEQTEQLATLRRIRPSLPRDSTILTFGHVATVGSGIWTAFGAPWVATSAIEVLWQERLLTVVPAERAQVSCARREVRVAGLEIAYSARYGHAAFVDLVRKQSRRVSSQRECRDALVALAAGGQ